MSTIKIYKFLKKTVLVFPFAFAFWIAVYDNFEFNHLLFPAVAALVLSVVIVFFNLFDYEKYDNMIDADFLESKHDVHIEYSASNWEIVNDIVASNFNSKVKEQSDRVIKLQIERKILDSELVITRTDNQILIGIKKKFISFLPDNAENYKTIKRLEKRIKTIANNAYK